MSMNIADRPRPQSNLHVPAPWLATSAEEARAFESVEEALAAMSQPRLMPDGTTTEGQAPRAQMHALQKAAAA